MGFRYPGLIRSSESDAAGSIKYGMRQRSVIYERRMDRENEGVLKELGYIE